jgi:serine-type anaerobic sulfatase-maturating enzyme
MGRATLIVKATRLCNLRCNYCHDWRTGRDQRMSFDVLAAMTARALRDPDHDFVRFIWHGGETTLLPTRFYEKALFLQSRLRRPGQVVTNQIQSNGTRLTPEWLSFLRRSGFQIGLSLDGPPQIHDRTRRYASGRPSFADVAEGFRRLREAKIAFGVLIVIDHEAFEIGPDAIFDFFVEHGVTSYGVLPARPTNRPDALPGTPADHYLTRAETNEFLIGLYDRWLEHGDRRIQIRELAGIETGVRRQASSFCKLAGGCLGQYFLVEPNGEVAHCDLFLGDDSYTLGSVLVDEFSELRESANMHALVRRREAELSQMRECPEFGVCQGWCPHAQYVAVRHDPDFTPGCCGLRTLIEHVRSRVSERSAVGTVSG